MDELIWINICPYCKTELDGTGTCEYDCLDGTCNRCGEEVPRFTDHICPKVRPTKVCTSGHGSRYFCRYCESNRPRCISGHGHDIVCGYCDRGQ